MTKGLHKDSLRKGKSKDLEEEIKNNLLESKPTRAVQLPDGRWVTEKLACHFAKWGAEHRGSSETPKDLEEAAEEYEHNRVYESELEKYSLYLDSLDDNEEPKMKEPSKETKFLLNADVINAFIAGAKWQKEQMMKEAVEARVGRNFTGVQQIFSTVYPDKYKDGDKVRIIVCKKED